ncbi:MAG: TolC family protein [Cyanobacteriota bacterium]
MAIPAPPPLPLAPAIKGERPKSNPTVLPPAATTPPAGLENLLGPAPLALPTRPDQVRINDLVPLSLEQAEWLAEVNSPRLKAVAMQVEEAKSVLRERISAWYPTLSLQTQNAFPAFNFGTTYRNYADFNPPLPANQQNNPNNNAGGDGLSNPFLQTRTYGASLNIAINWDLINPQRVPQIAAARDGYEKAKNSYLIELRDLRLRVAQSYYQLQLFDDTVRIGRSSVQSSLVNLRDARARFQAGVETKLAVMEAETQLARDQQVLTQSLASQATQRRQLAQLLDLPQVITPTAAAPSGVVGVWQPSLQESIIAAYAFREELDNRVLDISIANSNANEAIGAVQPFLSLGSTSGWNKTFGQSNAQPPVNMGTVTEQLDQSLAMNLRWSIFDGGRAAAQSRRFRQVAKENTYLFADTRNQLRLDVESSFFKLQENVRNLLTNSREVVSSREALRLARLRFQAGVGTQRNVVDAQRDVTQAEVRYSQALFDYNVSIAELQRRTGLDRVLRCAPSRLPAQPPPQDPLTNIPVLPVPSTSPCEMEPLANQRR